MTSRVQKLPKLEPVKFPRGSGSGTFTYKVKGTAGQPAKKVVAEIKRLSKKDIYPTK